MRLTITCKIALAMIGTVIVCVGTMAWITSKNLQRGFVDYLNGIQVQELDTLSSMLAKRYRQYGNFEWLRQNPHALNEVLDRNHPHAQRATVLTDAGDQDRELASSRLIHDSMGIGRRLSLVDGEGHLVFGRAAVASGIRRTIVVDGTAVGTLTLAPLEHLSNTSASDFVYGQIRDMLWLALALVVLSAWLALRLARQLQQPVAMLCNVAQRIAAGRLDTRVSVQGGDELAELAQHVNAMAHTLDVNEQQRRRMLADVAHELRTPLTVIRGEIEALLDGIRTAAPTALESLHVEVLHLNKLINDLHQLALVDSGGLHYQRVDLDLADLVRSIVQRQKSRIAAAGLSLDCKIPDHAVTVSADSCRLTQLMSNLLENSMRYTDSGGCVLVTLAVKGPNAELAIEDSAPGIPLEAHARLFERMYRVDQARSRECGGSGLGLSICKALVEAHGGTIAAMASFLGGVKIIVRLPLNSPPEN